MEIFPLFRRLLQSPLILLELDTRCLNLFFWIGWASTLYCYILPIRKTLMFVCVHSEHGLVESVCVRVCLCVWGHEKPIISLCLEDANLNSAKKLKTILTISLVIKGRFLLAKFVVMLEYSAKANKAFFGHFLCFFE